MTGGTTAGGGSLATGAGDPPSEVRRGPLRRLTATAVRLLSPHRLPYVFGMLASTVALVVLFVPTAIGIADNGDELRLICRMGMAPNYVEGQDHFFKSVNFTYHRGPVQDAVNCDYRSTAQFPLEVAARISHLLPGGHALDLRVLGVLYSLLFGAAIGLLVAGLPMRRWIRVVGGLLFVVVFSDVAMSAYFSTGYSEPLGYVGLLASVGLLFVGWRSGRRGHLSWLLVTTTVILLTVASKPQFGPAALFLGTAVAVRPIAGFRRPWGRLLPVGCALAVVLVGILAASSSPVQFQRANRYNAFFNELLAHSPDPQADLRELGLPPELARYAGTTVFSKQNATTTPYYPEFVAKAGYPEILGFYLRHPRRTTELVSRGFRSGADPRLNYLGMIPYRPTGDHIQPVCRLCLASSVGKLVKPVSPVVGPLLWLVAWGVGLVEVFSPDRERRAMAGGVLIANAVMTVMFVTAVFGDGTETTKHLMIAVAAGWLSCCLTALLLAMRVADRRRVIDD